MFVRDRLDGCSPNVGAASRYKRYMRVDILAADAESLRKALGELPLGRPMSCVPGYFEVINAHTVGSLTISRASIKWV